MTLYVYSCRYNELMELFGRELTFLMTRGMLIFFWGIHGKFNSYNKEAGSTYLYEKY